MKYNSKNVILTILLGALSIGLLYADRGEDVYTKVCSKCHQLYIPIDKLSENFEADNKILKLNAPTISQISYRMKQKIGDPRSDEDIQRMEVSAFIADYIIYPDKQKSVLHPNVGKHFETMPSLKGKLSTEDIEAISSFVYDYDSKVKAAQKIDYISFENYHRKLVQRLFLLNDASKGFSLRIMRFAEQPVAMLYCFIDGEMIHAYQSGFETDYGRRYSLLTTMLTQEIASSIENKNIKYFNFMFADDESTYKHRYSGETEDVYNISFDHNNLKGKFYLFLHGPFKAMVKKFLSSIKQKQG